MNIINRVLEHAFTNVKRSAFTSPAGILSYEDFWRRSDNLAGWIDMQMGDKNTPVIVYGHKDSMMLICFLACVKSGRPYCPIDVSVPEARVASIARRRGRRTVK